MGILPTEAQRLPQFVEKMISEHGEEDHVGLDTGFKCLNQLVHGLRQGLYTIGGMPGCGKTTLAWQIAFQVAQNNKDVTVIFLSLDQAADDLRIRLLSRLSGIESEDLFCRRLEPESQEVKNLMSVIERYKKVAGRMFLLGPDYDLYRGFAISEGDANYYDGESYANDMGHKRSPKPPGDFFQKLMPLIRDGSANKVFVVVDYLQKIYPTQRSPDDVARVSIVTDELRTLSERIHGPVLAVSEINRESYKNPGMDAFKNSGRIEYSVDVGCVLKRKGSKNSPREMEFEVLKNRMGNTGVIELDFYPKLAKFEEVDVRGQDVR